MAGAASEAQGVCSPVQAVHPCACTHACRCTCKQRRIRGGRVVKFPHEILQPQKLREAARRKGAPHAAINNPAVPRNALDCTGDIRNLEAAGCGISSSY